ncbi:uncharacterized protein DUF1524 [Labedella gwakjiensis]|uniref:Uncharacterized protein DUF1524 n=2 Tax=Labedella gwakjiensis TaxID=390269 RepID=A0A2P8GUY9_9MICO|nr:HNH endonuclease family protein [Labedella gwakjiensis]PSL37780.1 uncharacterized protein DUF1524 [Labedella gwakjiensis]
MARRRRRVTPASGVGIAVLAALLIAGYAVMGPDFRAPDGGPVTRPDTSAPLAPAMQATEATDVLEDAGLLVPVSSGLGVGEESLRVDVDAVDALLANRPVDDRGTPLRYERDAFGQRWADVDRNGCDQRNDVLARDLVDIAMRAERSCVVVAGTLHDAYTGTAIAFERGQDTSALVQIDHVVPLAWAWQHGAADWSFDERQQFANDLANLQAVDGATNSSKSSSGPGEWLPPAAEHSCLYVTRWVFVLDRYALAVGSDDRAVIEDTLTRC